MLSEANDLLRPEPKRDRFGRYLIADPDDPSTSKAYTRVTTLAKTIDDTYNLDAWGERMTALGLAARPELLAGVAACTPEDKSDLNKLCRQAKDAAGAGARATVGTALHRVTERVDRGEQFEIPEMFRADVAAYQQLLVDAAIEILPEFIEQIVVVPALDVAGTFDRIVRHEGVLKAADFKSGSSVDFAWVAIGVQLASYANAAAMYDVLNETHLPMPPVSKTEGLVFHVPAGSGTAKLYRVNLEIGWEAAQLCFAVRDMRKRKGISTLVDFSLPAPVADLTVSDPSAVGSESEPIAPSDAAPLEQDLNLRAPEEAKAAPTAEPTEPDPTPEPDPPEPDPTESTPEPGLVTDVVALRAWVAGRLQAIIAAGHAADVAKRWPEGVPTLKSSDQHNEAQLDEIGAVLVDVERLHKMRFPDPDPRHVAEDDAARTAWEATHVPHTEVQAEQLIRAAFPGTVDVSPASDADVALVIANLQQLNPDSLTRVQAACKAASVPNLRTGKPTAEHLAVVLRAIEEEEAPF